MHVALRTPDQHGCDLPKRARVTVYLLAAQIGRASNDRAGALGGDSQELEAEIHMASPTSPLVNEADTNFGAGPRVAHAAPPCAFGDYVVLRRGGHHKSD